MHVISQQITTWKSTAWAPRTILKTDPRLSGGPLNIGVNGMLLAH